LDGNVLFVTLSSSAEYDVMREIVESGQHLPLQISMEIHTVIDGFPHGKFGKLSWVMRWKKESEVALFMDYLYRFGGYLLIDRHDNPICPHCSEVVLAKLI
jgi:hypothetical protein